ncbi:MAG: type II toxin-antitoxin system PemK/MazF family toxin [Planctomycetota bacterium]|nr:type II toxin-antitoxin system PemK/MazF family toxin [Planctomycetota bacterium]
MRIRRGDIWFADLGEPIGSEAGYVRPVLIVQDNRFTDSDLATVVVISLTSNLGHGAYPGNVVLESSESGLDRDSVINVTQVVTVDKEQLTDMAGSVSQLTLDQVEYGLSLVLGMK